MYKILQIASELNTGGVETILFNYFANELLDDYFQIDFASHSQNGLIKEKLENAGYRVFYIVPKKKSLFKYISDIWRIIHIGNYNLVHVHQNFWSWIPLLIAKINKVPIRIVHVHGNQKSIENILLKIENFVFRYFCLHLATNYWACGQAAALWLYGKKRLSNITILPNAIDSSRYLKTMSRDEITDYRNQLGITSKFVVCHVARFTIEKSHFFCVEMIKRLYLKSNDYTFLFVGDGPLKESIENEIINQKLSSNVKFLGNIDYVNKILEISDFFILPSQHEGFPVTLVEAQFMGLQILCSTNVSDEVRITDLVHFLPITDTDLWVKKLITLSNEKNEYDYMKYRDLMEKKGFDISTSRKKLISEYLLLLES